MTPAQRSSIFKENKNVRIDKEKNKKSLCGTRVYSFKLRASNIGRGISNMGSILQIQEWHSVLEDLKSVTFCQSPTGENA